MDLALIKSSLVKMNEPCNPTAKSYLWGNNLGLLKYLFVEDRYMDSKQKNLLLVPYAMVITTGSWKVRLFLAIACVTLRFCILLG